MAKENEGKPCCLLKSLQNNYENLENKRLIRLGELETLLTLSLVKAKLIYFLSFSCKFLVN